MRFAGCSGFGLGIKDSGAKDNFGLRGSPRLFHKPELISPPGSDLNQDGFPFPNSHNYEFEPTGRCGEL